jgi:hypothetical protein
MEACCIHTKVLLHFARIMFFNVSECETIAQVLNMPSDKLVLNPLCTVHPAIKHWIARIHANKPELHKTPADWMRVYPKLLKGMALRFLHYHRSYKKKQHRLFCRFVFSHLACEVFCCRIGLYPIPQLSLAEEEEEDDESIRWFYPLDSDDYFIDMDIVTILLRPDSTLRGRYHLCPSALLVVPPPTEVHLLQSQTDLAKMEETAVSFMLRRYSVQEMQVNDNKTASHENVKVGMFECIKPGLHIIRHQPLSDVCEKHIYQVYPGDENKTMYDVPSLFVYRAVTAVGHTLLFKVTLLAHSDSHDQYVYFYLTPDTQAIVVVCSRTAKEAETILSNEPIFVV